MHNNINLLHISENSENKYVIRLMKTVFTNEEILGGYVIEAESSTSRFKKLYLERIKLVKLAYFLKYNIPPEKQEKSWKIMKGSAGRVCIDERKKVRDAEAKAELAKFKDNQLNRSSSL